MRCDGLCCGISATLSLAVQVPVPELRNSTEQLSENQYALTPIDALRLEHEIESYGTAEKSLTAKAYEKARRPEESYLRCLKALSNDAAPHQSKRKHLWRRGSENENCSLPLVNLEREPLPNSVQRP